MNLYEISQEVIKLNEIEANNYVDIETGEVYDEAQIKDMYDALELSFEKKMSSMACLSKQFDYEAKAIKEEEDKLAKRRKSIERKSNNIKHRMADYMNLYEIDKIDTPQAVIKISKSKSIETDEFFVDWAKVNNKDLLTYKEPTANKKAIKELLKTGELLDFARIVENENINIK